jgi:hypothetical protein
MIEYIQEEINKLEIFMVCLVLGKESIRKENDVDQ